MKKVALVTGGNKGIGKEVTRYFLNNNYNVIVVARDFNGFELADNSDVRIVEYDLSNILGIPELVTQLGKIDVLINNAGVMYSLPYDNYPQEKVDNIIKLNIESPIAMIREVSKQMIYSIYLQKI
jgi:short-subunit dehydrogenase